MYIIVKEEGWDVLPVLNEDLTADGKLQMAQFVDLEDAENFVAGLTGQQNYFILKVE